MVAPKDTSTWESMTIRLKKNPKKALLFQDICDLIRPVTNLYGDCPRLASQLKSVSHRETLETLCAQYTQQDQRLPSYSPPSTKAPGTGPQSVSQDQQYPSTQSTPQVSSVPAKCSSELAAPSTPPVQEGS